MRARAVLQGLTVLALLTAVAPAWAGPFSIPLDDGYAVTGRDADDVTLTRDGRTVVDARRGPLTRYAVTSTHIMTDHRQSYYVVEKASGRVAGPFSLILFRAQPAVDAAGRLDWKTVADPHPSHRELWVVGLVAGVFVAAVVLTFLVGVVLAVRRARREFEGPADVRGDA